MNWSRMLWRNFHNIAWKQSLDRNAFLGTTCINRPEESSLVNNFTELTGRSGSLWFLENVANSPGWLFDSATKTFPEIPSELLSRTFLETPRGMPPMQLECFLTRFLSPFFLYFFFNSSRRLFQKPTSIFTRFEQFFPKFFLVKLPGILSCDRLIMEFFTWILQKFYQKLFQWFSRYCFQNLSLDSFCIFSKDIFVGFLQEYG